MKNFEAIYEATKLLGSHLDIIARRRDSRKYDLESEMSKEKKEYMQLIINLDNQEIEKHKEIIKGLASCL